MKKKNALKIVLLVLTLSFLASCSSSKGGKCTGEGGVCAIGDEKKLNPYSLVIRSE